MGEGQGQMYLRPVEKQNTDVCDLCKVIWVAVFFTARRE